MRTYDTYNYYNLAVLMWLGCREKLTYLLVCVVRSNLWDWQSLSPDTGSEGAFFKFCDALEVKDGQIAPASGFGADHAVQAWAAYWKNGYLKESK